MVNRNRSLIPILLNNRGWAILYTLVFCIIIQSIALLTASIISHNVKAGNTFRGLLSKRHVLSDPDVMPSPSTMFLNAPEGWDHACFLTEVIERKFSNERRYYWRIKLNEQPFQTTSGQRLTSWMPHIILLIDDSDGMLSSCGYFYDSNRIYLQRTGGEIIPGRDRDDIRSTATTSDGTYYLGSYADLFHPASDNYGFGGSLQCWTLAQSRLADLIDDLDMCPMAIATVSRGIIQPFTTDRRILLSELRSIHPHGNEAHLSERLYDLTNAFPLDCGTEKHIIIATTGIAVNDGNIAGSIQDFDHDNNPNDTHITGQNSHCLDDVSSYARSKGIIVHTIGPDSPFLKKVATNGGGKYLPVKSSFNLPGPFICQMTTQTGTQRNFLTNVDLVFGPQWLVTGNASYMRIMADDPLKLVSSSPFVLKGSAVSQFTEGPMLLCSTSRDYLLQIDQSTGSCTWTIHGPGGKVMVRDNTIISGPNASGEIMGFSRTPALLWSARGDIYTASKGIVYVADGSTITAYTAGGGISQSQFNLDDAVCILEYDPCYGKVLAGSKAGTVYILDQDLSHFDRLAPDMPGTLCSIRSFHYRKELHVVAATQTQIACMTPDRVLWKTGTDGSVCTNAVVMDSKIYITAWKPDSCRGIDAGTSSLLILDALSGESQPGVPLFGAYAFGPLVDVDSSFLEHASWSMDTRRTDLGSLPGMKPVSLGSIIITGR